MSMKEIQRLLDVLANKRVDRPPVTGFLVSITLELMDKIGVRLPEAHHEPLLMVKLAAAAHEVLGLESMKLPFDLTVEAGALESKIDYGTLTTLPQVTEHHYRDPEEIIIEKELLKKGRIPLVLEAIRIARKEYGDRIPVISSIVGPLTVSGMLFGIDNLFFWMLEEPEKYALALRKVTSLCIVYAEEQFKTGTHIVQMAEPSASGDLISPQQFAKFVAPYHREICHAFELPVVIHICGNITCHLQSIAEIGARGISFEDKTDIREVVKQLKGKTALIGYVPTSLLLNGTPEEVYLYSLECLRAGVDVLNSGCAWPLAAPNENIKAMIRASRDSSPA